MTWSSFEGVVNSGTPEAWLGETAGTIGAQEQEEEECLRSRPVRELTRAHCW